MNSNSPTPESTPNPKSTASTSPATANQPIMVVQQSSPSRGFVSWLGWVLAGIFLISLMGFFASKEEYFDNSGGIQEKYHSLSEDHSSNKIAVIDASGVIMSGNGFVKKQIDRVKEDKKVKAIVLRVDSPGGTVYGSDYLYHHLVKLRTERELPMVVSMGSTAASGGYYISMAVGDQENCIFAEPMTTTGSIGVIIPHYNVAGLMEQHGIVEDSIATHPRKNMLSVAKEMTDDDREVIGKYIGHAFDRFKEVIYYGRPQFEADPDALDVLATGEVFTAKQAKESGLIDQIGFIEDAVERAAEMAGLDKNKAMAVTYTRPATLMDALSYIEAPKTNPLSQLIKLSTPRAYYLHAPLSSLMSQHAE